MIRWLLSLTLISALSMAFGQEGSLPGKFTNYTFEDGMTHSGVSCLLESSDGFIWIGTEEGLNRFDGVEFKQFLKDDGEGAITDNFIHDLLELPDGRMMVGTARKGLCIYDPQTQRFETIPLLKDSKGTPYRNVRKLLLANDSTVLIGYLPAVKHRGGLASFNIRTYEQRTHCEDEITRIRDLDQDPQHPNRIWTVYRRLKCADLLSDSLIVDKEYDNKSDMHTTFAEAVHVNDTSVLFGSWGNGVVVFDKVSGEFVSEHLYNKPGSTLRNAIREISPMKNGKFWVSTLDRGLGEYDPNAHTYRFFENDPSDMNSILRISARTVLEDSRGILWAGMAAGLSMKNPYDFQIVFHPFELWGTIKDSRAFAFKQAANVEDKLLLAGSPGDGMLQIDFDEFRAEKVIGRDVGVAPRLGLNTEEVTAAQDGHFYTISRGSIFRIHPETEQIDEILNLRKSEGLVPGASSVNTLLASNEFLWFGTKDNLFGRVNLLTDKYELWWLEGDGPTRKMNLVYEIAKTGDKFWIAANFGIYVFEEGEIQRLDEMNDEFKAFGQLDLESVVAAGDYLYFGDKQEGLIVLNHLTQEVKKYGRKEGLPSLRIAEMTVDHQGIVWGLTNSGIFSFDISREAPITVYTVKDGLIRNDWVNYEISTLSTGQIVLGEDRGINVFNPSELKTQPVPERLVIQNVELNGEQIRSSDISSLKAELGGTVNLSFQALGYVKPEQYQYFYRKVQDTEWQRLDEPKLRFSDLRQDVSYELIAANKQGEMMNTPYRFDIAVAIPFWMTNTFYFLLLLLFTLLLYLAYRYRLNQVSQRVQLEAEYNQRITEVEMTALRAQMNPHFLFNCLNSIKFFIINKETEQASDYLTKFSRLIRLILSNSKAEYITLSAELEALRLYVELESLRFDNRFEFILEVDPSIQTEFVEIPSMLIQPFVENSIWHGLMHKKEPGKLRVSLEAKDTHILCVVEDDGVGRKRAAELKSKSATREKSMGIDITKNRIMRLSQNQIQEQEVEVFDLTDSEGLPIGTKVNIRIPLQ